MAAPLICQQTTRKRRHMETEISIYSWVWSIPQRLVLPCFLNQVNYQKYKSSPTRRISGHSSKTVWFRIRFTVSCSYFPYLIRRPSGGNSSKLFSDRFCTFIKVVVSASLSRTYWFISPVRPNSRSPNSWFAPRTPTAISPITRLITAVCSVSRNGGNAWIQTHATCCRAYVTLHEIRSIWLNGYLSNLVHNLKAFSFHYISEPPEVVSKPLDQVSELWTKTTTVFISFGVIRQFLNHYTHAKLIKNPAVLLWIFPIYPIPRWTTVVAWSVSFYCM